MTCKPCIDRGPVSDLRSGATKCAFDGRAFRGATPVFSPENHLCVTADRIRDLFFDGPRDQPAARTGVHFAYGSTDQRFGTIDISNVDLAATPQDHNLADTLWVSWCDGRHRIDAMWLLDAFNPPRHPTEAECVAILSAYNARAT